MYCKRGFVPLCAPAATWACAGGKASRRSCPGSSHRVTTFFLSLLPLCTNKRTLTSSALFLLPLSSVSWARQLKRQAVAVADAVAIVMAGAEMTGQATRILRGPLSRPRLGSPMRSQTGVKRRSCDTAHRGSRTGGLAVDTARPQQGGASRAGAVGGYGGTWSAVESGRAVGPWRAVAIAQAQRASGCRVRKACTTL